MKLPLGILMTPENNLTNICTLDCRWYPVSAAAAAAFMTFGNPIFNARAAMLSYRIPSFLSLSVDSNVGFLPFETRNETCRFLVVVFNSMHISSYGECQCSPKICVYVYLWRRKTAPRTDTQEKWILPTHTQKHINYFLLTRKYLNSVTAPAKSNACLYEIHINICHPIPYSIMWILIGLKPEPHRILVTTQYICTCGGWVRLITRRKCQLIEPVSSDRTRPRMVMVVCHYIKKPMFVRVQFHVIIQ